MATSASATNFAVTNLRLVVADLEKFAGEVVRDLCGDLQVSLMEATPKDTTNAASGWTWDRSPRDTHFGSKKDPNWGPFAESLQMLAAYVLSEGLLYLDNAVSYIGIRDQDGFPGLDAGWSPQAPAGFISLTIRKVLARVRTFKQRTTTPIVGSP